ncbi:MAG: TlpA family protein disulfide reductase [Burkholderiales bacterium]|nr:TlpA family protein disulfide reductase [Burkholderiales bacterium]
MNRRRWWPLAAVLVSFAVAAAAPGEPAPALSLPDAAGRTVTLESLKGKVVYVDFWASWCGPCKQSFPWMAEMQRKYASLGLEIVAVNVDRKRTDAERFLAGTPAAFTVVFDAAGATPNAWNVRAMPSSYLVDRQGRVVHVDQGFREDMKAPIEARIRATLEAAR